MFVFVPLFTKHEGIHNMLTFVNGIFIQILMTINEYYLIERLGFCYIILQKPSSCCRNANEFI